MSARWTDLVTIPADTIAAGWQLASRIDPGTWTTAARVRRDGHTVWVSHADPDDGVVLGDVAYDVVDDDIAVRLPCRPDGYSAPVVLIGEDLLWIVLDRGWLLALAADPTWWQVGEFVECEEDTCPHLAEPAECIGVVVASRGESCLPGSPRVAAELHLTAAVVSVRIPAAGAAAGPVGPVGGGPTTAGDPGLRGPGSPAPTSGAVSGGAW